MCGNSHAYTCASVKARLGRHPHTSSSGTPGPGPRPVLPERPGPGLAAPRVLSGPRGAGGVWTCPAELPGTFPGASPALGSPRTRGSFDSGRLDRGQGVSQGGHGPSPTPPRWRPGRSPRHSSKHTHPTGCEPPEHRCVFTHAPSSVGGSTCSADAPRNPDTRPGAGPQVCCLPLGIVLRGRATTLHGDPGPARPAPGVGACDCLARVPVASLKEGCGSLSLPRPNRAPSPLRAQAWWAPTRAVIPLPTLPTFQLHEGNAGRCDGPHLARAAANWLLLRERGPGGCAQTPPTGASVGPCAVIYLQASADVCQARC